MSFRGISKAIARLPQVLASKTGLSEATMDPEYSDLESRFHSFEGAAKRLYDEARLFKDSLSLMLGHQEALAQTWHEMYMGMGQRRESVEEGRTSEGESGRRSAQSVRTADPKVPREKLDGAQTFADAMLSARSSLLPDLDVIERRVILPTADLLNLLAGVRKVIVKREHKVLDYDRHRDAHKKLRERSDRDVKDEKRLAQIEVSLEAAQREYNAVNSLLVSELPRLLELRKAFIGPCFQTLYWYQLKLHHVLHNMFASVVDVSGMRYGELSTDAVLERFRMQYEPLDTVFDDFRMLKRNQLKFFQQDQQQKTSDHDLGYDTGYHTTSPSSAEAASPPSAISAPPPYSAGGSGSNERLARGVTSKPSATFASMHAAAGASWGAGGKGSPASAASSPPSVSAPPPPKVSGHLVMALYDYTAKTYDELSFKRDDLIEVVERTADVNDWWTGRIQGRVGLFPANYVTEI
ncbi:hypothetical protein BJ742DRAFT_846170 [Cladochytrium replicatum]|nr:hypothetical protein BJ742DRAFT_846170 [Cladochytrium replicatum]